MKTNIKLLFAAGVISLTAGCTDLNVPVESQYTEYPSSTIAIEAKMSDIYYQLRGLFGRRYMEAMALSSDEETAISYSGNWLDAYAYAHPSLHNYSYEDATIDWMGELGKGCVKANEVINSGADVKYVAPARAMRAYFEFIMMDCWGDAPIIDETVEGIDI
ncbi:MAG: RagB/SusD family nutrient uptake outer membrane protein, partial [Prevotella sp.]